MKDRPNIYKFKSSIEVITYNIPHEVLKQMVKILGSVVDVRKEGSL